jgi:hypothetical protein
MFNKLLLIIEIPLALLSFLFFKITKFIIGIAYTIYLTLNPQKASQWRILSAETLKMPLSLPILMTKAPRWNTHAIIGTLGPLEIQESIAFDLDTIKNSTQSWIGCVYSFPSYATVASFDSSVADHNQWQELQLKPGKYTIGLRYYNWFEQVTFPFIKVDHQETIKAVNIPANINDFYRGLAQKQNWFYLWLHYYIFILLKLRNFLPESFVQYEYLPVGATDTNFFYGYINSGHTLQIEVEANILNHYNLYLTIYNRASLPVDWCEINMQKYISKLIENNSHYLIRVRSQIDRTEPNLIVDYQEFQPKPNIKQIKIFSV